MPISIKRVWDKHSPSGDARLVIVLKSGLLMTIGVEVRKERLLCEIELTMLLNGDIGFAVFTIRHMFSSLGGGRDAEEMIFDLKEAVRNGDIEELTPHQLLQLQSRFEDAKKQAESELPMKNDGRDEERRFARAWMKLVAIYDPGYKFEASGHGGVE